MGWLHLTKNGNEFQQAIDEITQDSSDRAVAIVTASLLEDHLVTLLRSRLVNDNKQIIKSMFEMDRPLGSFGARVNLGFLMSLYSQEAYDELLLISRIRNKFAHKMEVNSFNVSSIKELCSRLTIWEKIQIKIKKVKSNEQLLGSTLKIVFGENLSKNEQSIFLAEPLIVGSEGYTPKQRYLNACRFFIAGFSVLTNMPHKMPKAAFQSRQK